MLKFDPASFTISTALEPHKVWGSGHSLETDPTRQGWRCARAWKHGPWMIGQRGVVGCATFVALPDNKWDVAIYYETPAEVVAKRCAGDHAYHTIDDRPGFGLVIINLIRKERDAIAAFAASSHG